MNMSAAAKELMNYMRELSEEAYHAGWMLNLEYDLWKAVLEGPCGYGQTIIGQKHIESLKELSKQCGGWIIFDEEQEEAFIPMEQWLRLYEEWAAKRN